MAKSGFGSSEKVKATGTTHRGAVGGGNIWSEPGSPVRLSFSSLAIVDSSMRRSYIMSRISRGMRRNGGKTAVVSSAESVLRPILGRNDILGVCVNRGYRTWNFFEQSILGEINIPLSQRTQNLRSCICCQ